MSSALTLPKYSLGTGDRFAHQAKAQLAACLKALDAGLEIIPVWNKSNREHTIIGSEPSSTRVAADAAVTALNWKLPYFLDADHISLTTVSQDIPRLAGLAVVRALARVEAQSAPGPETVIAPHLIIRGTTAPAATSALESR